MTVYTCVCCSAKFDRMQKAFLCCKEQKKKFFEWSCDDEMCEDDGFYACMPTDFYRSEVLQ